MNSATLDHIHLELSRLDLLLHREILRLRARYQLSLDEFRGLYVSDEQADRLIEDTLNTERESNGSQETTFIVELTARAEKIRHESRSIRAENSLWPPLIAAFDLSDFEKDLLLLALAPEIDKKYETLYAYLNNDITRKTPTRELALRLFADERNERLALQMDASLFREGALIPTPVTPDRPYLLSAGFTLSPTLTLFLLGSEGGLPELGQRIACQETCPLWNDAPLSEAQQQEFRRLSRLLREARADRKSEPLPIIVLEGRQGSGRRIIAERVCSDLKTDLQVIDVGALRGSEAQQKLLKEARLLQKLRGIGFYLTHLDVLLTPEGRPLPEAKTLMTALSTGFGPVFLACEPGTGWKALLSGIRHLVFPMEEPDYKQRQMLWRKGLQPHKVELQAEDFNILADRYALMPGQIRDAVQSAIDRSYLQEEPLSLAALLEAARMQSSADLGKLASKVTTSHHWEDLVLPVTTLKRVKEVASAIGTRHLVYSEWGFGRRITTGRGIKALFAGASGTGKTMTAGVIARELGLELFKIDLSSIVSKYIGETEKNLEAIFRGAQASSAILFFDEADALFSKRSEVKDAHDRYANIETAYLLQRMEEYEGAVVLASNLSKNIDEAFSRRMHYVIDFPLPDENMRLRLWEGMFPPEVPISAEADLPFLAKQFALAGGDIRNVALDAAFLAAQDGRIITMKHLTKAMARQMLKQGKIPSHSDFKQYHPFIAQDES